MQIDMYLYSITKQYVDHGAEQDKWEFISGGKSAAALTSDPETSLQTW